MQSALRRPPTVPTALTRMCRALRFAVRSMLLDSMSRIEQQCADLVRMCRQAYTPDLLEAAALQLESTTAVLKLLSAQRSRESSSF